MKKLKNYLQELRAPFFTATIVPVSLGSVIAWEKIGSFNWVYFLLALLGGLFLHAGTNILNDFFDHRSGNDEKNYEFVRPFTGGSRLIQKGILSPKEVFWEGILFFFLASLIGIILFLKLGKAILILGVIGLFSGYFYTAPPLLICATGFGEVLVGLNFGVLMTVGAYFVQTKSFSLEPVIASLPVAILISAVLYINEFQDFNADKEVGKTNLVVRFGREKAASGYVWLMLTAYGTILIGVVTRIISPFAILGIFTLPIALKGIRVAKVHYDNYIKLTPANVATIMTHLLTGILIVLGYVFDKFI